MAKTFILADEALNNYGFWLPMSGADLKQFKRNPIMLWMHQRPWRGTKDEVLPLGTWENIRIENGQLLADAVFDQNDDFALAIESKVEAGIIRMASPGLRVLKTSNDPKDLKPGQTRETPIKWQVLEASIVDIGGSDNALALALYDECEELINLADASKPCPIPLLQLSNDSNTHTNQNSMKKILSFFNLADTAQEDEVLAKAQEQAQELVRLKEENTRLAGELKKLEDANKQLKEQEIAQLLNAATTDGRIDAKSREMWKQLFDKDFDNTKAVIENLAVRQKAAELLDKNKNQNLAEREELEKLSWDELDKGGKLEHLKEKHADLFDAKFKEKFGTDPMKK